MRTARKRTAPLDTELARAYVRYMAAGVAAAYTGPSTLSALISAPPPPPTTIVWGETL
ncbi:hypothetical protein ACFXPS_43400 [Nocardia sp. NPDC059091]|uniref:hypothetical protein n=1 Tax=unclassified Nocardia TaxID=2637762 RepID=UPI00368C661D